ncbi:MAG: neutral zinc metallopeptidase [Planctomycetaceae bacterium]|nr:neutral zinc metallopeptidase [Planctomycetaceae bacterium]
MRWKGREQSSNVEDRRGSRRAPAAAAGGGGLLVIVIMLVAMYFGMDQRQAAQIANQVQQLADAQAPAPVERGAGVNDESREFISVILRDTEKVWGALFQANVRGGAYEPPQLVIFADATESRCGMANAATGPFYCPTDRSIYIDPSFFEQLHRELGAPGDFAQAYVIAHEVAHHVQQMLGFMQEVERARGTREQNRASVRLELQADFLAGVWAHHAEKHFQILEAGDIDEAIRAANSIGDDRLQELAQGYSIPERYTHGTSAQRVKWFKAGFKSGNLSEARKLFELDYDQL